MPSSESEVPLLRRDVDAHMRTVASHVLERPLDTSRSHRPRDSASFIVSSFLFLTLASPAQGFVSTTRAQAPNLQIAHFQPSLLTNTPANESTHRPPVTAPSAAATRPHIAVLIDVLANDSDPDGDPLMLTSFSQRSNATVLCPAYAPCSHNPHCTVAGLDPFSYSASDCHGGDRTTIVALTEDDINQGPHVDAGPDQTITLPASASLNGVVTDDGLPNPPGAVKTHWSKLFGAGSVTFANADAPSTTARFSLPGTYFLTLTADDGELISSAVVTITVAPNTTVNTRPSAGVTPSSTVVTLPGLALLGGFASDDGLPKPPGHLTISWETVSGPGQVFFGHSTQSQTTASFSKAGSYLLRMTADDGELTSTADVSVTVSGIAVPIAQPGADQIIPVGTVAQLDGRDSIDASNAALSYRWLLYTRPAGSTAALATTDQSQITFTPDVPGIYAVQLTVNNGSRDSLPDSVLITAVTSLAPPPSIEITGPVNNSTFPIGSDIPVYVVTHGLDQATTQIDLSLNGAALPSTGQASRNARIPLKGLTPGTYQLLAAAKDATGGSVTSIPVTITVAEDPTEALSARCSAFSVNTLGSKESNASVFLTSDITSNNTFAISCNLQSTSSPITSYKLIEQVDASGEQTIIRTESGLNSLATTVAVTVSGVSPGVRRYFLEVSASNGATASAPLVAVRYISPVGATINAPRSGTTYQTKTPILLRTAFTEDADVVAVCNFEAGVAGAGSCRRAIPYQFVYLPRGLPWTANLYLTVDNIYRHTYRAERFDNQLPRFQWTADLPPLVNITSPSANASFTTQDSIVLQITASAPTGINAVEVYRDTQLLGLATGSQPNFTFVMENLVRGGYNLSAKAYDNTAGNAASQALSISVADTPQIALTTPGNGASFVAPADIRIAAIPIVDPQRTVARVDFFHEASFLGSATQSPYTLTWSSGAQGHYDVVATVTDSGGSVATSKPVSISVVASSAIFDSLRPSNGEIVYSSAVLVTGTFAQPVSDLTINGAHVPIRSQGFYYPLALDTGPNDITLVASTLNGSVTQARNVTRAALALAITTPNQNSTIKGQAVDVSGTFAGPSGSSITVGGTPALTTKPGLFTATSIPLNAGSNSVAVVLQTPDNQVVTQTLAVVSSPAAFIASVSPQRGIAPLSIVFKAIDPVTADLLPFTLSVLGPGPVQQTGSILQIATPGEYAVTITATFPDASTDSASKTVLVEDPAQIHRDLRELYTNLVNDLKAGNIDRALTYFSATSQQRYRAFFLSNNNNLSSVTDALGPLQSGTVSRDFAEYFIIHGQTVFRIYFLKGEDGVWRIDRL